MYVMEKLDYRKIPLVKLVDKILVNAAKANASDIHFDPYEKFLKVRVRIDGDLIDYLELPEELKKPITSRIKILSNLNITETRLPQDGPIKATIEGVKLDIRVSTLPTQFGEKIVLRLLDYSMSFEGLEALGFAPDNLEKVKRMMSLPHGIILVTGATGTGKTTTLYSILQQLNKENVNIITVEDPIEMPIPGINQLQVNPNIGLTFATALRSILRQDPNIIMIGEIRDSETARIAIRASITGHLVLSTIHTNNSLNTIERLLDMDVERYLLATALEGVISQNLVRKVCDQCKTTREANYYEKELFRQILNKEINTVVYGTGCEYCNNNGYRGRIAIQEVLEIDQDIRDMIAANASKELLREEVYGKHKAKTILEDGIEKAAQGLTTVEEVLKIVDID